LIGDSFNIGDVEKDGKQIFGEFIVPDDIPGIWFIPPIGDIKERFGTFHGMPHIFASIRSLELPSTLINDGILRVEVLDSKKFVKFVPLEISIEKLNIASAIHIDDRMYFTGHLMGVARPGDIIRLYIINSEGISISGKNSRITMELIREVNPDRKADRKGTKARPPHCPTCKSSLPYVDNVSRKTYGPCWDCKNEDDEDLIDIVVKKGVYHYHYHARPLTTVRKLIEFLLSDGLVYNRNAPMENFCLELEDGTILHPISMISEIPTSLTDDFGTWKPNERPLNMNLNPLNKYEGWEFSPNEKSGTCPKGHRGLLVVKKHKGRIVKKEYYCNLCFTFFPTKSRSGI